MTLDLKCLGHDACHSSGAEMGDWLRFMLARFLKEMNFYDFMVHFVDCTSKIYTFITTKISASREKNR